MHCLCGIIFELNKYEWKKKKKPYEHDLKVTNDLLPFSELFPKKLPVFMTINYTMPNKFGHICMHYYMHRVHNAQIQ